MLAISNALTGDRRENTSAGLATAQRWAERLFPDHPQSQDIWLEHYLGLYHRNWWWTIHDVTSDGVVRALCFLGPYGISLFYDGKRIHGDGAAERLLTARLGKQKILKWSREHSQCAERGVFDPPDLPSSRKILSALAAHHAKGKSVCKIGDSGTLSSFTKRAREHANQEMCLDLYSGRSPSSPVNSNEGEKHYTLGNPDGIHVRGLLAFEHVRSRYYLRRIGAALRDFRAVLPQDIMRTLHAQRLFDPAMFNWLAEGNSTRRIQALKSSPLAIPLILGSGTPKDGENFTIRRAIALSTQDLSTTIDQGRPLVPCLARHLRVQDNAVALLNRFGARTTGTFIANRWLLDGHDLSRLMAFHHALPGNRRPTNRAQWNNANFLFLKYGRYIHDHDVGAFLAGTPLALDDPFFSHAFERESDIQDAMRLLTENYRRDHDYSDARHDYLHRLRWPLVKFLRFENDVHRRRDRIRTELTIEHERKHKEVPIEDVRWPGVLPAKHVMLPGGWQAVELTCATELDQEALAMHHCVDSYVPHCLRGRSRIVSIRDPDGERASTVEFALCKHKSGKLSLVVLQNQACFRDEPSAAAKRALTALRRRLRIDTINTQWHCDTKLIALWYAGQNTDNVQYQIDQETNRRLRTWFVQTYAKGRDPDRFALIA